MVTWKTCEDNTNHFRCNTNDILNNKHIPINGKLDGVIITNGDELYVFAGDKKHNVYMYDIDTKTWEQQ